MSAAEHPHLAVVIPTFNSERWIGDTVQSAVAAANGVVADDRVSIRSAQVIVVDDGSTVPTQTLLGEAQAAGVTIVRNEVNRGQHAATLAGISSAWQAGAACIVTVDDDLLFGAGALVDLMLAAGWKFGRTAPVGVAYGVVGQASEARRAASRVARWLIRWRPEWVATSIRCIPADWCAELDDRPIDTQLLSRQTGANSGRRVVRVAFESHDHPSARSRYGIVGLLRHAGTYVRSWAGRR